MKRKRIISSLLCLLLILSSLPFQLVDSSANYQNYPSAYIGNKSHFLTEVSFEREGNYSGCIKVTLFLGVEAQNIPEELRKISTFNSLIKIDASLLSPVSSAKATRGQPTLNSVIENAGASPKYNWLKRDAGNSFAIFNQEVPYLEYNEDEEEYVQKSSSFDISISSLSYNAVTNTCYCDFSGMNLSGISWSENFDKEQKTGYLPIAYLYLARLNENIELPLLRNAISLAKEEEIRAESGCLSPNILNENSISTTTEKSRFVTDSGISFTDDFYPKYDVTFKRFSDGETADDIVVPTTEGKIPEAPEVADYTKGDYLYSFISWDREITAVESETTYTAQYSRTFMGHDYIPEITKQPDCENKGETTYICSRCGDSYCEDNIPALGHDWSDWIQTTDPDCTNEGVETRTCKRNSAHFETRPVEPLGHNYVPTVIEPTVRNGGYTVHTCSRCLDSYSDDFTDRIPLYYSIPAYEGRTQTLVFINAETRIEVSSGTGQFLINDLPDGSYNVFALSQNCLTRFIDTYTFSENNYVLENAATLPTGDVNHDGIIDIADISLLISEDIYGTENIEYNLCDDNTINIKDIAVILYKGNYLSVADLIK